MISWEVILTGAVGSTAFTIFLLLLPSRRSALPLPPQSATAEAQVHDEQVQDPKAQQDILVQVVVLGDIGRSPRMQYHALSIAKNGGIVDFIGYLGNAWYSCSRFLSRTDRTSL